MGQTALSTVPVAILISNRVNTIARLPVTRQKQNQQVQLIREVFQRIIASKMVLVHKDIQISTLEDIQKLKVKDLRESLRSNSETTGGMKADLVLKVYALIMRKACYDRPRINSKIPMIVGTLTRILRKMEATSSIMKF